MSKSYRDGRQRRHSGKNCPESAGGGCVYCITGEYKSFDRRKIRRAKHRTIKEQLA